MFIDNKDGQKMTNIKNGKIDDILYFVFEGILSKAQNNILFKEEEVIKIWKLILKK